jgi:hypothetical protein
MVDITPWSNFYVLTGGAAASLTGLMFVVITLITSEERATRSSDGIAAFSTPTVLHFGSALFVSAVMLAPWHSLNGPAIAVGLLGLGGVTYLQHRLRTYAPDAEDWTWYTILPFVAYGGLLVAALLLRPHPAEVLFGFAGGTLVLIFIGIHNAWDVVTFIVTGQMAAP